MNNIDNDVLKKIVPRIFKIINNLPENMDVSVFNNIFDENEKLKHNNNKLLEKVNNIQNRKDNNETKFINVYHNLKKKIDNLQKENSQLQSREYMLLSEYEHNEKSKVNLQDIINKKDKEISQLKNQIDDLNNKLIFKKKEESLNTNLLINKIKNEYDTLQSKYDEQIKMNNGYKKLIDNYKEDLRLCEDKNKKNVSLLMTIENEKNQLESKFILINQQINLLNEENHKLKKDIDILKNQKNITLESIIKKLENEIEQKNNEIEALKIKTSDTNIISKLNEVIENQNNELKSLDDKYKNVCENNDRLKLENIELQVEINHLIKSDDDSEYSSNYDTEYESDDESDEETELKKNTRKLFGLTHRKLRQPTQDFFDNLLIEQQNEKCKEVVIKEPIDYSFSTDYHVDMLQNSYKLVPKEERKYYNDKQLINNIPTKDIFVKNHPETEANKNINNSLEIIINDKENSKIIIDDDKKVINEHKIQNINHIVGGGKNKDRFTIHDIEGTLKMYINNDFSTITDQNIDKNDIDLGRKIYNRKNVRRCRNKNN